MKTIIILSIIFNFATCTFFSTNSWAFNGSSSTKKELSDQRIKKLLISRSVSQYSGNCPCPYFTDRAGRRCGKRSAYVRLGGASPLCYKSDISDKMIQQYKEFQGR